MVKKIFLIGAMFRFVFIKYLIEESDINDFKIRIGDKDLHLIDSEIDKNDRVDAFIFDVFDDIQRNRDSNSDIVISMLPANLHIKVAED